MSMTSLTVWFMVHGACCLAGLWVCVTDLEEPGGLIVTRTVVSGASCLEDGTLLCGVPPVHPGALEELRSTGR